METRVPHHLHHHLLRPKATTTPQSKASRLIRAFPLLLLIIYAATVVLRLASSPSPSSHDFLRSSNSFHVETAGNDLDAFKTHIASKDGRHLHAKEETTSPPRTISCPALIDGKSTYKGEVDGGILCCDRSHYRTDLCYMRGDVRTHSSSSSILLHTSGAGEGRQPEKIRPYTRKWETPIMSAIDELTLVPATPSSAPATCDVRHNVTGLVISTGGYTGNVYHEFNDGLLPLYLTADRFAGEVVLVVLEYHPWWVNKYKPFVDKISRYDLVDFRRDRRVHCFPEVIVGLRIHGELAIDPQVMPTGKSIGDFQSLLGQAFGRPAHTSAGDHNHPARRTGKPKIAIFVRHHSRVLLNLRQLVRRCLRSGFQVEILNPKRNTSLHSIFKALDSSDVMMAVHGAAMTHLLFMRPRSVVLQIVPLGLDWAAEEYYGRPARQAGLDYVEYKVVADESSLSREYGRQDPVIADPEAVTRKGWQETKRIYLEHQNVTIDLKRFGRVLAGVRSVVVRNRLEA